MENNMEERKRPYRPITPGEIIKEELDARGWTQGDFAEITGKPLQAINEIIAGKKIIIPETAILFSEAFGTSPEFWLNLESAYRLDLLYQEKHKSELVSRRAKLYSLAPVKELIKRGWIKASKSIDQLELEVCNFLGIPNLGAPITIGVNFRKSNTGIIDNPSLLSWVKKAEIEAKKISCAAFKLAKFKQAMKSLNVLSSNDDDTRCIPEKLRELGIRLVFVPHLPQTCVDGAAFWLDKTSPVIALSLRMDRVDNFWFTLMHELVHIMETSKDNVRFIDSNITEPESEAEKGVNQVAGDLLITSDSFTDFVNRTKPYFSRNAVISFAQELGIHPAIVVGRLQYEKLIPYTNLRNFISKVKPIFAGYIEQ